MPTTWWYFAGPREGADFDVDFRPPLAIAWRRELDVRRLWDGMRLGGDGRIVVTTGGTGIAVLDSRTGKVLSKAQSFRCRGNAENLVCAFGSVLAHRAAKWEPGGARVRLSVLDLSTLRLEKREVRWTLTPVGTFRHDGQSWLLVSRGKVRMDSEPWEFVEWPEEFKAEVARGPWVVGYVSKEDPAGPNPITRTSRRCIDVRTGEELWSHPMEGAMFRCWGVTDRVVCADSPLPPGGAAVCTVYALDDGRELWRLPIDEERAVHVYQSVVSGDRVYLKLPPVLECRDALSGELVWTRSFAKGPRTAVEMGNLIATRDFIWLIVETISKVTERPFASIVAVDKRSGEVAWKARLKDDLCSHVLTFIDNAVQLHHFQRIVCAVPSD